MFPKISKLKCIYKQVEAEACEVDGHGVFIYCPACDIGATFQLDPAVLGQEIYNALIEVRGNFVTVQPATGKRFPQGLFPHSTSEPFEPRHHFIVE